MAFGFSPKYVESLELADLSPRRAYVAAVEAAKSIGWNIGSTGEAGFVAYTQFSMSSWSEEVRIRFEEGSMQLKSECAGNQLLDYGKNKKNIKQFIAAFQEQKSSFSEEEVEAKYAELEQGFATSDASFIYEKPLSGKEKISSFLSVFKPTEGYFITPILINLNILLFVLMAATGVNIMLPDNESLILWGANFRPVTLEGGWWRLLSSCFLHIGVLHLLMNMYALLYIGLLLEPYLGKSRFLAAYLLTGVVGSVASVYWHELTISAGASGSIFGMYGVFLAMLTTNLIEKSARKALLTSIVVFVGFNLVNGLQAGIDNAAHLGGLISGMIIGYAFYPSLVNARQPMLKPASIGLLAVLLLTASFAFLVHIPNDIAAYEQKMQRFISMEAMALEVFSMPQGTPDEELLSQIENRGIYYWNENMKLLAETDNMELPAQLRERNARLKEYCQLRIKSYQSIYKSIAEKTNAYDAEIDSYNQQIERLIRELTGQ